MDDITRQLTEFLSQRSNYERTRPDRPRFTLATMTALLAGLGAAGLTADPRLRAARAVQVAGSKGKGTTAALLAELADASGLRVGVYASPHVHSLCERVRIGGEQVAPSLLSEAVHDVTAVADSLDLDPEPSFFEVLTAAAQVCFARSGVDLAVYEAGLGARLDATTALPVDLGLLTGVELEHTQILGDTVAAIAAEKAFAVRPAGHGLTAAAGEALEVLRSHCRRVGARLEVIGEDFGLETAAPGDGPTAWRGARRDRLTMPDLRQHERPALALAWAALEVLWPGRSRQRPLRHPDLPGRCEFRRCADGEWLLLDGAHTAGSAAVAASELLAHSGGRRGTALLALARGKRVEEVLSALRPAVDRVLATRLADTPSVEPADLCEVAVALGMHAEVVADPQVGCDRLLATPGPRCVLGSFYLIGEVEAFVPGRSSSA